MKYYLIILLSGLFLSSTLRSLCAQENTEDRNDEEVVTPASVNYIDFIKKYFHDVKTKNATEILWSITDSDYRDIKNDDFKYEKVKDEKRKAAEKIILEAKDVSFTFPVKLVVGKYDFKNESYTVDKINYSSSIINIMGDNNLKNDKVFFSESHDKVINENALPNMVDLSLPGLKNFNSIKVPKEIAEKVSSNLDKSREIYCYMNFNKTLVKLVVHKMGKFTSNSFEATAQLNSGSCFSDEKRAKKILEF